MTKSFERHDTKKLRESLEWAKRAVAQARREGIEVPAYHLRFIREVEAEIQSRQSANDPRRRAPKKRSAPKRRAKASPRRELAAAVLVAPNTYALESRKQAKMFADILIWAMLSRSPTTAFVRHSVKHVGKQVRTKNIPWSDIEWADAYTFKYG